MVVANDSKNNPKEVIPLSGHLLIYATKLHLFLHKNQIDEKVNRPNQDSFSSSKLCRSWIFSAFMLLSMKQGWRHSTLVKILLICFGVSWLPV
jgi:hypothetical protein